MQTCRMFVTEANQGKLWRCGWCMLVLFMLIGASARADCIGEYRDTTPAEKEAWDQVLHEVPPLISPPPGYVPGKSEVGVSRDGRCNDGGNPIYLPLHMHLFLNDEERRRLFTEVEAVDSEIQAVYRRFRPRFTALQQEMTNIKPVFPVTPEYEARLRAVEEKTDALKREQKRELAPLETKRQRLVAREKIEVDAYFNAESSGCGGKPVEIGGAVAACLETWETGEAKLTVLFGPWQKDEEVDSWDVRPVADAPTHALRSLKVVVSGTREAVDAMRRGVDWQGVQALLDGQREEQ